MRTFKLALLGMLVVVSLAACGGESTPTPTSTLTASPVPTSTYTPMPTTTPPPTNTPPPTQTPAPITTVEVIMEVDQGQEIPPPIRIVLPEGWSQQDYMHLYADIDGQYRLLPFTTYRGSVTGGEGFILLLWAFENVVGPFGQSATINLYADGLRLLRLVVIEPTCLIGTDVERGFTVGDLPAVGAFFSAVNCQQTTDTRGWFAVLRQDGLNFAFYIYTEPLEAMNGIAMAELEDILDTVTFHLDELRTREGN